MINIYCGLKWPSLTSSSNGWTSELKSWKAKIAATIAIFSKNVIKLVIFFFLDFCLATSWLASPILSATTSLSSTSFCKSSIDIWFLSKCWSLKNEPLFKELFLNLCNLSTKTDFLTIVNLLYHNLIHLASTYFAFVIYLILKLILHIVSFRNYLIIYLKI